MKWLAIGKHMIIVALCVSCGAMTGCIESQFDLAAESRLPRWITIPPGITRADVAIEMRYYTVHGPRFFLRDKKGRTLAQASGKETRHVKGLRWPFCTGSSGIGDFKYPCYAVITVNGVTEVIEHRKMEPVFYVTDDPAVRKWLLDLPATDK